MLQIPVLTLHNERDPLVPFSHEERYLQTVEEAGTTDMLYQRTVTAFGHCEFTIPEILTAFSDLVDWVETGSKP
jgi:fermentation-respiration switch protein FrsA (DUF1100 family)